MGVRWMSMGLLTGAIHSGLLALSDMESMMMVTSSAIASGTTRQLKR